MLYTHVIIEILIDHYFYKIRIRPKVYDMLGHVLVLFLEICKLFLHDIESGQLQTISLSAEVKLFIYLIDVITVIG